MPLKIAEGAISLNPQPTARNFNKPARMLRLGLQGRRKLYRNIRYTGSAFESCHWSGLSEWN